MKLGGNSHVYEIVEGWGRLPEGVRFGYTHGVVVDSQDRVYVHNQSKDAVIVFDRDGNFLSSWGEEFAAGAHGMFLSRERGAEYLYLADYARHIVVKTTLDGKVIWTLGVPDMPNVYDSPEKYKPTDVAVAPNGDFYIGDGYGQSWIHQYNKDAKPIRSWGGLGSEPGKLNCPHGVWVDTRRPAPVLLVADRGNRRIQIFSLDGKHIGFVTEELRYPCCFYQFGDEIYIPDLRGRVTIFDKNNKLITHLGDNPGVWEKKGWPNLPPEEIQVGKFNSPHALCVDSRGDIYVVEWIATGRLTKLHRRR
jgi:DNA-binding beta-propeller fold protein YncE